MKSLWRAESTTFAGEFFQLEGGATFAPKPVRYGGPPVLVGLNTTGLALKAAVRCADGINTWQLGPEQLAELIAVAREHCARAGRDPADFAFTSDVVFAKGATVDEAGRLAGRIAEMARGGGRSARVTQWDASGVLCGDADEMAASVARFAAVGVTELSVAMTNVSDIEWFSGEVIPRCR